MAIIKEVDVKVVSVIDNLDSAGLADGESERTESSAVGYIHIFDGEQLLTYAEEQQGQKTVTEIKIKDGSVRVIRRGAIESDMFFDEGSAHKSLYTLAPYKFDAEVRTKKIRGGFDADGGKLTLIYDMSIGGADKSVRMSIEIKPRG